LFCTKNNSQEIKTSQLSIQKGKDKHPDFAKYWYNGTAEITSYELLQSRYGETRKGTAVNIFVTENFLPEKQVKADYQNDSNIPVLKLNATKNFVTGIYPYSLMTSTFTPTSLSKNAIKISYSSQEWCGNTFIQLNNRKAYEIDFRSYFETNADKDISLEKTPLENDFWNLLRINPKAIKTGNYKIIPSFEYLALQHKEIKPYTAEVTLTKKEAYLEFSIVYKGLNRKLTITIEDKAPYLIESWEESFSKRGITFTNSAKKIKTIQSPYWSEKGEKGLQLRKELGL
jgi:hypothetical protein